MEMFNPTEKLELLAASASEIHAASERSKLSSKLRVEFKSDEDRTRKRQLRLLKNRQSAALSRQRKKEYITDLEERTNGLITENHDLSQKVAKLSSLNGEFKLHIDTLEKRLTEAKNESNELKSRLALVTHEANPTKTTNDTPQTPNEEEEQPRTSQPTSSPTSVQTQNINP